MANNKLETTRAWRAKNKERISAYNKGYYQNHSVELKAKRDLPENKAAKKTYDETNKPKTKKHQQDHKEENAIKQKAKREAYKEQRQDLKRKREEEEARVAKRQCIEDALSQHDLPRPEEWLAQPPTITIKPDRRNRNIRFFEEEQKVPAKKLVLPEKEYKINNVRTLPTHSFALFNDEKSKNQLKNPVEIRQEDSKNPVKTR